MNKVNIFLDDYRKPRDCVKYISNSEVYLLNEFIIVKDYPSFKDLIDYCKDNNVLIDNISFDHDLTHSHYGLTSYGSIIDENDYTGYHACKYFLDKYTNVELERTNIHIHTMSDFGFRNIKNLLVERCLKSNIKCITPYSFRC